MVKLNAGEYQTFESIKYVRGDGSEYWLARELAEVLEYAKWENFSKVIQRAILACNNSGYSIEDHFPEIRKMVEIGSKTKRALKDFELSRYACYLILQNGDPRKEVIALGQTYFAIQTRRAEVADAFNRLDEENKRLVIRGNIKQWNQLLAEAAHNAQVITDEEFSIFQNAGYIGLYGGMTVADIHRAKELHDNEKILDFMGSTELIANLFRISQTEEKLRRDEVQTAEDANETHFEVGDRIRTAIIEMGSTLPEDLPTPAKSIKSIEREEIHRLRNKQQKLMLDE